MKKNRQKEINSKLLPKQKQRGLIPEGELPYVFIACNGQETEPNYIKGIAKEVNNYLFDKYFNYKRKKEFIKVKGYEHNTLSLLRYVQKQVEEEFPEAQTVWLVYDKDDFPNDNFDNTEKSAKREYKKRKYKVAWSNECFELWFVLHFQYLEADIGRKKYIEILKKYIPEYEKNIKNMYEKLKDKTSDAIKRAEKLYNKYDTNLPPSQKCPATRMYELIKELNKYL